MARTLSLRCLNPGGGTYLVDGGRPGMRAEGIVSGGPADLHSMQLANQVLGQAVDNPCLEIAMVGGEWLLYGEGEICLTGADVNWQINGKPAPRNEAIQVKGETRLAGKFAKSGFRTYLGVRGQWDIPRFAGSGEVGIPGIPSVAKGWKTPITSDEKVSFQPKSVEPQSFPEGLTELGVLPGPEWPLIPVNAQKKLLSTQFRVGRDSNRQGVRLLVDNWSSPALPPMLSSPVLPGTVQLTPAGPVVLGVGCQTIGGYPRVLMLAGRGALNLLGQTSIDAELILSLKSESLMS